MKTTLLVIIIASALAVPSHAAEFTRWSTFKSPEAFVETAKAFKPATNQTDLSACFTTRDLGQPKGPETGNPVFAPFLSGCTVVWSDDVHALIFAVANPPTKATRSEIGVLFLLMCHHEQWQIDDLLRFTANGKDAAVSVDLTAGAGTGYRLGGESMRPVVTIKESQGGRGYSYSLSSSYTLRSGKFSQYELE